MSTHLPPAARLAERLARDIEQAWPRWHRVHRFGHGMRIRGLAWDVLTTINRAAMRSKRRPEYLAQLRDQVDDLKVALQLGRRLAVFRSKCEWEAIYRQARELGQQVGGWYNRYHPQGQDAPAHAPGQRAIPLSTRGASIAEANR